jgi:hypothetical protein
MVTETEPCYKEDAVPNRTIKVYLSLKAVVEAIMEQTWEEGSSLYMLRYSRKFMLSDEMRHTVADLPLHMTEHEATDMALAAIARADGAGRVAWLGEWTSNPGNCRRMLSYVLGRWKHASIPVSTWEATHQLGYPEAIIKTLNDTNPGRFEIHS